jgi:tetratricopeptide (TPR) repeat protein
MKTTGGERSSRPSQPTGSGSAARWLLALALAGAALAVGTVHTLTLCVITVVLLAAALLAARGSGDSATARPAATLLLFTGVGLVAYTALQCVPVPIAWLSAVSPHNADVWSRALAPLHEPGPAWAPISLDPVATRVEVLKGVAYLLAFFTALVVARRREGVTFLGAAIVVTALVLATAALLHPAFGAHKLFGLYAPEQGIAERHLAPLLDPNNLAGYVNLALCMSLAAMLAQDPPVPRSIAGAVVLLLAAVQVWIASRGGVVTMVFGALVVIAMTRLPRARARRGAPVLVFVTGATMVVGVVFLVIGGSDQASLELFDVDVSKARLFAEAIRIGFAMPLVGCGRGAFESVFPAFRTGPGYVTYTHPENVLVQWGVEWGFPVAIASLALVVFAIRPRVALARPTTAVGAWAGLVALGMQNLGDLGTEVPGLVLAAVVCAAMIAAGTPGRDPRWRIERWARRPRRVALAMATAAAAALMAVLFGGGFGHELHDDQGALYDAAMRRLPAEEMHAMARAAMLRHPAEPYLPYVTSMRAARERDDNPLPWIGATLERARVYAPAHLALARLVAPRSPSQARLEYRLTVEQEPAFLGGVMNEAQFVAGGYSMAMELVPDGDAGIGALEALATRVEPRLPATRVLLDREQAARAPSSPGPAVRLAQDAVEDLEAGEGAPWCMGVARDACIRDALARAERVVQLEPAKCDGFALRARARLAGGNVAQGLADLEKATDAVTDRVSCLKQLAAIARRAGDVPHAERALDRIVNAGCADDAECAAALAWVAQQDEANGNLRKALVLYKRASERAPDDDALLERSAALAGHMGLHAESAAGYERLARKHPGDLRWRRAADTEHEAAMREAVRL